MVIGLLATALAAAFLLAYAEPFSMAALSMNLEKPAATAAELEALPVVAQLAHSNDGQENVVASPALALQPEALKLSRRLGGQRFNSKTRPALIIQGVVGIEADRHQVQMVRYPSAQGERVEVVLASRATVLSWDATSGARSSLGALDVIDRTLLERLIFDSADQFILGQLRGASYYVVARNVRPDDAPDNYSGPLWNVVRLDDPEPDEQKRPLSRWRLYYLNTTTGLIDKIVCDSNGERIEATFSDWTERAGEKVPSTIIWSSNGKTVMTFTLTNASVAAQ